MQNSTAPGSKAGKKKSTSQLSPTQPNQRSDPGGAASRKDGRPANNNLEQKKSKASSSPPQNKMNNQKVRKYATIDTEGSNLSKNALNPPEKRSKSLTSTSQLAGDRVEGAGNDKEASQGKTPRSSKTENQRNSRDGRDESLVESSPGRRGGNMNSPSRGVLGIGESMEEKVKSKSSLRVRAASSGNAITKSPTLAQSDSTPDLSLPMNTTVTQLPNSSKIANSLQSPSLVATRTTMVKSTVGFDRSRNIRTQVEKALREHKIYTCIGVYPAIRKALQKRGWIEKNGTIGQARSANWGTNSSKIDFDGKGPEDESDQAWMNRVLRDYPPDFIWVIRRDNIDWRAMHKDQLINRYPKAFFTTKVGITACLQNIHWFSEAGVADTFFPRCYRLCMDEEKTAFIDDYRLSACIGLLKWVVAAFEKEGETGVMDQSSRVVSLAVDFAIRQINNYVRIRRHEDIDWLMPPAFTGQHWDVFLNQYYTVVQLKGKLAPSDSQDSGKIKYEASKRALQRLTPFWPQFNIDGMSNIWICKPGARSRGRGIVIMNQLDKILDLLAQNNCRESNWVVQKYIERPLLVYKTKFDIRQWFIVTDWSPLTVWFYKESYIRFCTKPFCLEDFHESVHLCNNAIQCRYQNSELRDSALPDENMWDCYTFQAYLKTIGKMDMWDSLIYPGMKQGIIGVLLASQETVDVRKNCFELYGADFMLSEDLRPWLIEINSCPCMAPSTSVTARMCAQCLEDTIKVTVDRRDDRNAETGNFELIYKQGMPNVAVQPFNGIELVVQGKKLTRDVDWPSIMTKYNSKRGSITGSSRLLHAQQSQNPESGLTFMDLVQRLRYKGQSKDEPNADAQKTKPSELTFTHPVPDAISATQKILSKSTFNITQLPAENALPSSRNNPTPEINAKAVLPSSSPGERSNLLSQTPQSKTLQTNTNLNVNKSPSPDGQAVADHNASPTLPDPNANTQQRASSNDTASSSNTQKSRSSVNPRKNSSHDNGKSDNPGRKQTMTGLRSNRKSKHHPFLPTSHSRSGTSARGNDNTVILLDNINKNDVENPNPSLPSSEPSNTTEISLSTFLKNSATVADLIRLRKEAEKAFKLPVTPSSTPSDDSGSESRNRSTSRQKSRTSSDLGQEIPSQNRNNSGRIRPNARTSSYSSVSTPLKLSQLGLSTTNFDINNNTPSRFSQQPRKTKASHERKKSISYEKIISTIYNIHRINTLPDDFEDPTALKIIDYLQPFRPVRVLDRDRDVHVQEVNAYPDNATAYCPHNPGSSNNGGETLKNYPSDDDFSNLSNDADNKYSLDSSSDRSTIEQAEILDALINCNEMVRRSVNKTCKHEHSHQPTLQGTSIFHRLHQHNHQPCYRLALEHPQNPLPSKRPLTTFPIKTVNLNLL